MEGIFMSENSTGDVVPHFTTITDLQGALEAKNAYEPVDLYPRDGTSLLGSTEAKVADLVGVNGDELILCNSGMAAIVTIIETFRRQDTVIAVAEQTYSQTTAYLQRLAMQGVTVTRFDSDSPEHIDRVLRRAQPDIVLTETVGNGPDVPIFDADTVLDLDSFQEAHPLLVLDNTLPLSTTNPLDQILCRYPKAIGVESGTKAYTFNQELSGLIYAKDDELLERVKQTRRTLGTIPGISATARIDELLPRTAQDFHGRNNSVFRATEELAAHLNDAVGSRPEYFVAHPTLDHFGNNHGTEDTVGSPVLFINCFGELDQFELTKELWSNPAIREHAQLGQSFGFDSTRILPDAIAPFVRIAGGAVTDTEALGKELAVTIQRS